MVVMRPSTSAARVGADRLCTWPTVSSQMGSSLVSTLEVEIRTAFVLAVASSPVESSLLQALSNRANDDISNALSKKLLFT